MNRYLKYAESSVGDYNAFLPEKNYLKISGTFNVNGSLNPIELRHWVGTNIDQKMCKIMVLYPANK